MLLRLLLPRALAVIMPLLLYADIDATRVTFDDADAYAAFMLLYAQMRHVIVDIAT